MPRRLPSLALAALMATTLTVPANAAPAPAPPAVERHAATPPGLILAGVTLSPQAKLLILSGQLAAPLPASAGKPQADLTIADFGDTRTQTVSVLNKIKGLLAAQGYTLGDVVKMTAFVAGDPKLGGKMDFAGFNDGFKQFFGTADNPATTARSTVQVAALVNPAFLIEIEVIAAK